MKRKHEEEQGDRQIIRLAKRRRHGGKIHLFRLSDELLLRSLSFLPFESLVKCERVCKKFRGLSRDNELWREKYFNRFVRHRARRLPGVRGMSTEEQEMTALRYSSRQAKWLEHSDAAYTYDQTDWKHLYKVKHNWNRGKARRSEVYIDSKPEPIALAKMFQGMLYTADTTHGLRVWKKGDILHVRQLSQKGAPSALAIGFDADARITRICVGYQSGAIEICSFDGSVLKLDMEYVQPGRSSVGSVAVAWPYLMLLSTSQSITLLQRTEGANGSLIKQLATLHSDAALNSATLSLRRTSKTLLAGIAYAFNRFGAGWCLGLQEIRMDLQGIIQDNRSTSSISSLTRDSFRQSKTQLFSSRSASTSSFSLHPHLMRAPNSLSYCGCYILAGLPDNTLMVYTVTSTDDDLSIDVGRRLWGHTSAISAAEVSSTGKAVSISSKSDEMRYWELEEVLTASSLKRTSTSIKSSGLGLLSEAMSRRGDGLGLTIQELQKEDQLLRRCVSFDDEQAIVVGERGQSQIISCFDFA